MKLDKYHGVGGSYSVDPKTGERTQTEKPTERHPDGDCARDKDGKPLDKAVDKVEPAFAEPAPKPWEKPADSPALAPRADAAKASTKKGA